MDIINVRGLKIADIHLMYRHEVHKFYYCGRQWGYIWKGSALGNPFKDGTREENIRLFRIWLWEQMQNTSSPAYKLLLEMATDHILGVKVVLGCWCAPKACHCEIIRRAVLWLVNEYM